MHRPVFSMTSVADKMRNLKPDVPDPMLKEAAGDPSRLYLFKQVSFLNQQNVIGGEALDKLIEQAVLTNGRVSALEPKVESNERFVQAQQSRSKEGKWRLEIVWMPALFVGLQIIAHKLGYL